MEKEIIQMAVEAGISAYKNENEKNIKQIRDKRLQNTKLLFKNYRLFSEHCKNAIFEESEIDEKAIDIMDLMWSNNNRPIIVESIKNSTKRTYLIMKHIDEMLDVYKIMCEKSGKYEEVRRYNIIYKMYCSDDIYTASEIAEMEDIDNRTVYKDISNGMEKLSALIFGVDFIK